jgi:hypothetical protein
MKHFNDTWIALAEIGVCDGYLGAEYKRARDEWIKAGRPTDVRSFITIHANVDSHGPYQGAVPCP